MAPRSRAMVASLKVGKNAMKASEEITGLASDSRKVEKGFLFAALGGARADGGAYVDDAVARGASVVLGRPELRDRAEALGVRFIETDNPRLALAIEAARFYRAQPEVVAAVTGTNGKTSVSVFLRQIWTALGMRAASLGTIGAVTPEGEIALSHTTPDPIELHRLLAEMKASGIDRLAVEASSHGLDQYRLDGVEIAACAFTNLTRDHLDYHPSVEHYFQAKLRLVELTGELAVVNADADYSDRFAQAARRRGLRVMTVGATGHDLKLESAVPRDDGQVLRVNGKCLLLPLAGSFQASNALVAAGLAIGLGADAGNVFAALEHLQGAPGRLELVAPQIYVDYAHTPDALETVLKALRPHASGRLVVVFGCGGDRDKGKRPLMGDAASRLADSVIVTDDNPRSEDPATIRGEILAACPGATEIGDRAEAIRTAIRSLAKGDVLVIAGKGHESGQTAGGVTRPFSDRDEARRWA
ncbi:MAG TPA: UDP-N-acetylmuramoyl-L-alanyl-D-glutamate--2,6-diaminopimelate ligase [Rhizomicrobium sp.]|nr:UDP-N-acetylmuramoyl-L-alanyl-D-glutamate--2,6-diaminopimelate ligase [Rhizomicrobium sp.]